MKIISVRLTADMALAARYISEHGRRRRSRSDILRHAIMRGMAVGFEPLELDRGESTHPFQLSITEEQHRVLRDVAAQRQCSLGSVVRGAVLAGIRTITI